MSGYYSINQDLVLWGDHMPDLGLHTAAHLDLDGKRAWLFGRNTIDDALAHVSPDCAIVFDHYLNLSLISNRQTIFFPVFFLQCCVDYADLVKPDHLPTKRISLACPMNKKRYARVLASCWLANHQKKIKLLYTQNWKEHADELDELLQIGGLRDWTCEWGPELINLKLNFLQKVPDSIEVLGLPKNTKQFFEDIIVPSAATIVLEPVFWEHGCMITEKYLQAVLGGCIPVVNGYKIYDHLKILGFETFEDIIDQSSQHEKNSVLAIWNLMDKNFDFFQNSLDIYHDKSVRDRLLHNINHIGKYQLLYQRMLQNLNTDSAKELFARYKKQIFSMEQKPGKWKDILYDIKI